MDLSKLLRNFYYRSGASGGEWTNRYHYSNSVKYNKPYDATWTDIELFNNVIILICENCDLKYLPKLPHCELLWCNNNQITYLSELPRCVYLDCRYNQLTYLPELPRCNSLYCLHNQLIFDDISEWQKFWSFKRFWLGLKYIRLMYKGMLWIKAKRKYKLHLELQYSPNLTFYKNHPYYNHWMDNIKL